ncbi:MAG: hypothetical protein JWR54_3021 [Mucilaginibacter sp.]|nr:hypothetical protein [Mucilaginibacter sp.]
MTKLIVRTTLLTLLTCFTALLSKAQIGYDYARFDVGFSVGFNQFYGDVATSKSTNAVSFNFNYNQTPFLNYIIEGQFGKLAGGGTNDPLGRQFATDYQYYAFRVQLQAGEIIDYSENAFANALKNLYAGTGIGIIYGNVSSITRYSTTIPGYYTPGENKSNQVFLPMRIGYEFKIFNQYLQPNIKIDIGYQYDIIFGDEIDGYRAGQFKDSYSQFTIGAKFSIAGITSYHKQIDYFH